MVDSIPVPDNISIKSDTDEISESDANAIAAALTLVRHVTESGQSGMTILLQGCSEEGQAGEICNVEISTADKSGPHLNS